MLFGLGKRKNKDGSKNAAGSGFSRKTSKVLRNKGTGGLNGVNKLFHGVAVRARGDNCCQAVEALGSKRFLSEEAPLLPLAECSDPQRCRCVYEHFDERRDNLRREADVGMPVRTQLDEKRAGHGRRITDG